MDILASDLNPQQHQAVTHGSGPLLILAGAGTGKTRVLTHRLAHLIASGDARPSEILAVTFTNKAATEMRDRLDTLVSDTDGLWLGTFHGLGLRILRERHKDCNLDPDATVIDADDQQRLMADVLADWDLAVSDHPPRQLVNIVSRWKDHALTPEQVPFHHADSHNGLYIKLYQLYQERMTKLQVLDYGDLLLQPLRLLQNNERIRLQYQRRFKHILVDEAQDMNPVQYAWLRQLAPNQFNICLVGDDDQSIYSWRGADTSQLLNFSKHYPDATTVRLEQNYRSTPAILRTAEQIISQNRHRLPKTLWTKRPNGPPVAVAEFFDERAEAKYAAKICADAPSPADCAILVRTAVQTAPFEEALTNLGVPYRVIGALRFYDRKEIRDALGYLRLIVNSNDDLAFQRVVNLPSRGVGPATLRKLRRYANQSEISMEPAATMAIEDETIKGKAATGLRILLAIMEDCRGQLNSLTLAQLMTFALDLSGYQELLSKGHNLADQARREHIEQLLAMLEVYQDAATFLEQVALAVPEDATNDAVTISTIHAAKGLEFDTVFLPGLDNGILPHKHALESSNPNAMEEERRLAYVAITRAQRRLYLSHAKHRRIHGQFLPFQRSVFLDNL